MSVDAIARKRLISEIDETEKLFKCDVCNFSTMHQQNLRVHQGWLINYYRLEKLKYLFS